MTSKQVNYLSSCITLRIPILRVDFDPWKSANMFVVHCDPLGNLYNVEIDENGRTISGVKN